MKMHRGYGSHGAGRRREIELQTTSPPNLPMTCLRARAVLLLSAAVPSVCFLSSSGPFLFCWRIVNVSPMKPEKSVLYHLLKHKQRLMVLPITRLTHRNTLLSEKTFFKEDESRVDYSYQLFPEIVSIPFPASLFCF